MTDRVVTKEEVVRKLDQLLPESLAEVDQFIEFLRYRISITATAELSVPGTNSHPAFGIWADRQDIVDSAQYARALRQTIEVRRDAESSD
jgi:hypothetical protein